jgi:hypothetical protein
MSYARGNGQNGGHFYSNVTQPVEIDLNFIIDSTNGNGLGIRSLKSNGYVQNVFMHTTVTPGSNLGQTNPNPIAGYAVVQFKGNYRYYLGGFSGQVVPLASTNLTSMTANHVYVITTLGTATVAQWQAVGVIAGVVPSVGTVFVASGTTVPGGATVGAPGVGTAVNVNVVGDPSTMINNTNIAANAGSYFIIQFSAPTAAGTTTLVPASPADGTTVGMTFKFDISSATIDGL